MAYISEVGMYVFNSNFSSLIKLSIDNGTPPLYSVLLAISYLIFSKSLWVAHLLSLVFAVGLLWQINKLSIFFVSTWHRHFIFLLVLADPVFNTQFALMGYDIAILFFLFWSLRMVFFQKTNLLFIPLVFIALLNLRGFTIVISLLLIHCIYERFYLYKKIRFKLLLPYFFAVLFLFAWLIYHYSVAGFFAIVNGNKVLHQNSNIIWICKNLALYCWKILDFNRFALLALIVYVLVKEKFWKKTPSTFSKQNYLLLISIILFFVVFAIFFAAKHYPVSHRYFLPIFPLISLLLIHVLKSYSKRFFVFATSFLSLLLFLGNYYFYPPKYGNAWDTSLKVLPYFEAKSAAMQFIKQNKLDTLRIASFFPETRQQKFMSLDETQIVKFEDFCKDSLDKYDVVFTSNVINSNYIDTNELKTHGFIQFYKYQKQFVYITLFKNQPIQ